MSRKQSGLAPRLIEWERVRRIATNVSARDRDSLLVAQDGLNERYARMVDRSGALIADYVGQPSPVGARSVHVFDRAAWIDANIANFELLFESIERINTQLHRNGTVGTRLLGEVNRLVLSGQMGVLMGFLARRVLGQYDLTLLGREPLTTGGRLYFVEPNIAGLQRRLGLDGSEFRLWISLHETTHAFEFEAHPWLRTHMNGLLTRYLDSVGADLLSSFGSSSGLVGFARRLGANLRQGGHMLEMLMSAEQRDVFRQLQALMCLVEGYSNHVMDAVGQHLLLSYGPMKRRFEERVRRRSATERLFARVTGLDLKLEQYALGERFVNEVVARRGIPFANRAWQSAWHLPTLDEVRAPERWIARIGR
ncbi:MAG: zinc-dependent metalloprotease [Chloroflexi bacterium]|nr:zinc-dependent metalloprotease [Chloroflexota bacterium]